MIRKYKCFTWLSLLVIVLTVGLLFYHYLTKPVFPKQVKIGATYMTMNNDFYKYLNAEVEKSVNEQKNRLLTRDPALSIAKQVEQIDFFIKEKVDFIIINPVDGRSKRIIRQLKRAKKVGIKIILVDSQLADSAFVDTTIVSDNYQAGVLCAKHLMAHKPTANILLLEHRKAISANHRIQGFQDTIKQHPTYRIVARIDSLGQTEIAMPQVRHKIANGVHFDTVMALNDQAAIGALAATKEAQLAEMPYIYGVDGSPDMKTIMATTDTVSATVAQSPYTMGKEVLKAIERLRRHKKHPKEVIVPVKLITKDNLTTYDLTGWQ